MSSHGTLLHKIYIILWLGVQGKIHATVFWTFGPFSSQAMPRENVGFASYAQPQVVSAEAAKGKNSQGSTVDQNKFKHKNEIKERL